MTKIWDVTMQVITPNDMDVVALEEKLGDIIDGDDELLDTYFIKATLAGNLESEEQLIDSEDEDNDE